MTIPTRAISSTDVTTVDNKFTREAAEVQSTFAAQSAQIAADRGITEPERMKRMGKAWTAAKSRLSQLQADEDAYVEQRKTAVHSTLFGMKPTNLSDPSAVILARDATDRAGRLNSHDEASAAMQRAKRDGDTTMVKAIASAAADNGWRGVLDDYLGSAPHLQGAATELEGLNRLSSPQAQFGRAFAYGLATPSGYSDWQLRSAAAQQ